MNTEDLTGTRPLVITGMAAAVVVVVSSFLPWWSLENAGIPAKFTGIGRTLGVLSRIPWTNFGPGVVTALAGLIALAACGLRLVRPAGLTAHVTAVVAAAVALLVCLGFALRPCYAGMDILDEIGASDLRNEPLWFGDSAIFTACYGLVLTALAAALLLIVSVIGLVRFRRS